MKFKLAEELYRSGKVDAADKMLGDARDKLSDSRADFETAVMSYVVCNRPDEAVALLADMRDEYDNDMNARRVAFDTYLQLGYMDHADQLVYSLRVDSFPEYAFWYYRGQLSEAGGEFQIACRMYEYAITFEKTCMSIYRDLARTMAGLNNFALMEDHMQNVLYYTEDQGYPEEVFDETRLMFAEYYAQTRQWGPALGQIAEARKRFAGTARLELLDASVRGYMLQTDSAKEHLERFAISARPSVANYQGLARVWGQLSNLDSAEHYLKKALELDPADIGMRLTQSQIQLQKGDSATYQKALQEMHVQFPGDKRVTRALAGWFAGKGDLTSALDLANQLIDTYPGDLSTYKLAARTATSRYGVEQGREYYRKAISNNPNLPAAQHMLALDFISDGQSDSASVHLDKALKILPLYEPARLARGVIFESRQSPDSAIAIYTQIIKENPFNADAYNNLAWVLASNGLELPRSSNLAREAIHLSGGRRANMHGTLGWTYYRQDQFQRASGSYSMAIQLQPDDPFKHYLAGVNFADWGKLDEARAQLDTALALGLTPQYSSNLQAKLDSASSN